MTILGREKLDHPALGTAGGSALHAAIDTIYTNVANDNPGRFKTFASVANSAVSEIDHNFGVAFNELNVHLYTGSHPNLTRVVDPTASGWTIAPKTGSLKTIIEVTAPSSGGPHTFAVNVLHSSFSLDEITDVDLTTTAPQDGESLVYDQPNTKWIPGASSGVGELNVISKPNKADNWVASGAGVTVATTTTLSELPLEGIIKSGVKITGVSGTDYARIRWTMPDSFLNRTHKVEWEQKVLAGFASGDFTVELHTNSASNYGGSYTQKSLFKGSSIIASDGKFTDYFDAGSELYYELRIKRAAGTASFVLSNLVVGPGIQAQGAVITDWVYALTTGNWGTVTGSNLKARRVGNCLEGEFSFISGTPPAGASAIILPSGLTVNYSVASTTRTERWGAWNYVASTDTNAGLGSSDRGGALFTDGSTTDRVFFAYRATSAAYVKADQNVNSGSLVTGKFLIPIAEWGGSNGTLNTGVNDVEYAFNTSTNTTTTDTTSFGYGPQGALTSAITAYIYRTVRFQSPIQPTDKLTLEMSSDRLVWKEVNCWQLIGSNYVQQHALNNTTYYGAGIDTNSVAANTDCRVAFGAYASTNGGAAFGGAGIAWPAADLYWRVRKERAGVAVGFGLADATGNPGLVNPYNTAGGGVVYADTYTPTLTNVNNAGALANEVAWYQRVGKFVTVYGSITLTPSSGGGTATSVGITLPIATNLTSSNQVRGTGVYEATSRDIAYVGGDATNDRAELSFKANATGNDRVGFHFSYMLQ